jgi:ribosome maturation factor RimP
MSLNAKLAELLSPAISRAGFVLEEVTVTPAGKRRIVSVVVDREDSNPSLDEVTLVSKEVSALLDDYSELGSMPFTLEVTTPGVDRPLTQPRHWRKNIGRLVKITPMEGEKYLGRIKSVSSDGAILDFQDEESAVNFADIRRAVIEIEFNRKNEGAR